MSTVLDLSDARARGISLPVDDAVAQDILDEVEDWVEARIGPLTGSRTETFYVGVGQTHGRLALKRTADSASVTDGGAAVNTAHFRIVNGAELERRYEAPSQWWSGPYVAVTYTPNDADRLRGVLYDLLAVASTPATPYQSEQIGSYSYSKGAVNAALAAKASLLGSLLPKRDHMVVMAVSRRAGLGDPVINRAEPAT